MKDTIKIQAYNAAEFAVKLQEAFIKGYRLDLETNENYPTAFGSFYSAGLVKESKQPEVIEQAEVVEEAQQEQQEDQKAPTSKGWKKRGL